MPSPISKKTDRGIAVSVLTDVLETGAYANIALRKTLANVDIDPRARAFVTDMVNETLRNLLQIDHTLNNFSKTPVDKMKPFIRNLLRISVCQIKFMDKIPDRAAVNEAVVLVKAYGFDNLSGYVNGVLRNVSREERDEFKDPMLKYSYPKWLMDKLKLWLGEEGAISFCENSHRPPPVIVIANTHKVSPGQLAQKFEVEGINATPLENTSHPFFVLRQTGDITKLTSFQDGWFYVLDPGTMHAVDAINPQPGQTIIDLCAAPGGKTFAIASIMKNKGTLLSYDLYPHRVELISQTRKRLGHTVVTTAVSNALIYNSKLDSVADAVLLDVPCSGLGTIRKHPEIKYTRKPQDITALALKQREMLAIAAKYVRPGGRLVYCTCTVARQENGDNIRYFLDGNQNYSLLNEQQILPSGTSDGFYVAVLQRCNN